LGLLEKSRQMALFLQAVRRRKASCHTASCVLSRLIVVMLASVGVFQFGDWLRYDLDPLRWTPDCGVRPEEGALDGASVEIPAGVPA
jgi:hypothetical protein